MAFFSTVRGLPILDHVILFCRLALGAYRVPLQARTTFYTVASPARPDITFALFFLIISPAFVH